MAVQRAVAAVMAAVVVAWRAAARTGNGRRLRSCRTGLWARCFLFPSGCGGERIEMCACVCVRVCVCVRARRGEEEKGREKRPTPHYFVVNTHRQSAQRSYKRAVSVRSFLYQCVQTFTHCPASLLSKQLRLPLFHHPSRPKRRPRHQYYATHHCERDNIGPQGSDVTHRRRGILDECPSHATVRCG